MMITILNKFKKDNKTRLPCIECFSSCVFLGRQRIMAELKAAQVGQGCSVPLVAEPRIGKTPTAEELATVAGQY